MIVMVVSVAELKIQLHTIHQRATLCCSVTLGGSMAQTLWLRKIGLQYLDDMKPRVPAGV